MNIVRKIINLLLFSLIFFGCDGNYRNVKVTGFVKSYKYRKPINNAKVTIKCGFYNIKNWESATIEKETLTNETGYFEASFDKGEALDIIVTHDDYKNSEQSQTLKESEIRFDFYLKE
jgi:hypothetical protein